MLDVPDLQKLLKGTNDVEKVYGDTERLCISLENGILLVFRGTYAGMIEIEAYKTELVPINSSDIATGGVV